MSLLGVAAVAVALVLDLDPVITVAGMLLVVAGLVKIAMVGLWNSVANFGGAANAEAAAANGSSEERRR